MAAYNPVDYKNLGDGIASVFMQQPLEPLTSFRNEAGSGIYAFYYNGNFPPYRRLSENFREQAFLKVPIYIGQAMPKSNKGLPAVDRKRYVAQRIRDHRKDYQAVGLADDLHVRYLILSPVWVVLAETHLIRMFQPVWNTKVQGKGGKIPGKNRKSDASAWDLLHPGRGRTSANQAPEEIDKKRATIIEGVNDQLDTYFADSFPPLLARVGQGFVKPDEQGEPVGEPE